jgi:hypothetical protein
MIALRQLLEVDRGCIAYDKAFTTLVPSEKCVLICEPRMPGY